MRKAAARLVMLNCCTCTTCYTRFTVPPQPSGTCLQLLCCRRRMLSHWFAGGFVLSTCPISYLTRSLLLSWQQEKTMSIGSRQFLRVKLTRNLLFSLLLSLCYGYRSCVAFFFPCPRHSQRCCFVSERQLFRPTGSSQCWQERTEKRAAYTGINKNLVKSTLSLSRQG